MPNFEIENQTRNFGQLTIKTLLPESTEIGETTYEGNLVVTRYEYTLEDFNPSSLEIRRTYQNTVKKMSGDVTYDEEDGRSTCFYFKRNDKLYYMEITTYNDGRTEVSIIEVAELLNDLEILDADTTVYTLDNCLVYQF